MSKEKKLVIKIKDKEIEINEEVLQVLYEYIHTPMTLEQLAERLRLESWDEAYEFIKKVPAWIMWTPPSLWKYRKQWIQ